MHQVPETFPWERTANGLKALREPTTPVKPHLYGRAMVVGRAKMKEVHEIRADFPGHKNVFFEPYIDVWFKKHTTEEFLGLYQPGVEWDEDEAQSNRGRPHYCLRKVCWDLREDALRYQSAKSKKAYLNGEEQIDATSVFITLRMYPELQSLIDELKELVQHGIALAPAQRSTGAWDAVQVCLRTGTFEFHCYYSASAHQSEALEQWMVRWQQFFSKVDYTGGILPTGNFFVDYGISLEGALELFPE